MLDATYTFLALTTLLLTIPITLLNVFLAVSIAHDRSHHNRTRWFNSIFLYFVIGNIALSLIIGNFMPLVIPEPEHIFIIFSGFSIHNGVWAWFLKPMYAVMVGVLSYLTFIPPIATVLRYLVREKVLSTTWLQRSFTLTFFHLSAIPFWFFTYWFLFINEIDEKEQFEQRIVQLMGGKFPFIVIDSTLNTLLLIVFGSFLVSSIIALLFHVLFVQSTAHVQNEVMELGYQDSKLISDTFFSIVIQIALFITLPHLFLSLSIFLKLDLSLKAIPIGLLMLILPFSSALTIFKNFKQYKQALQNVYRNLMERAQDN